MKQSEAAELVTLMASRYPGATFSADNATSYEREFMRLERDRVAAALDELVRTNKFIPSIAEIHHEIVAAKREEARRASISHTPQPITDMSGRTLGPRPEGWRGSFERMVDDAARYDHMARAWYASKGKPYPGDPAAGILQLATAGARGDDIGSALGGALSSVVADAGRTKVD